MYQDEEAGVTNQLDLLGERQATGRALLIDGAKREIIERQTNEPSIDPWRKRSCISHDCQKSNQQPNDCRKTNVKLGEVPGPLQAPPSNRVPPNGDSENFKICTPN